jgi:hypothetical protein
MVATAEFFNNSISPERVGKIIDFPSADEVQIRAIDREWKRFQEHALANGIGEVMIIADVPTFTRVWFVGLVGTKAIDSAGEGPDIEKLKAAAVELNRAFSGWLKTSFEFCSVGHKREVFRMIKSFYSEEAQKNIDGWEIIPLEE